MMAFSMIRKILCQYAPRNVLINQIKNCHSVFGLKDIVAQEKPEHFTLIPATSEYHALAMEMVKNHYLNDHVLVRARNLNLKNDRALDEYLFGLFKQGNTIFAKTPDNIIAGICVGFATSPVDARNLRNFAFYRQDPNTKDFLNFTAKLQETPNLWDVYKQPKIFEIKMLAVAPEYRRQGLAVMLVEKAKQQALDQGYQVIRMDCINPYDYKIAERCMLQCIVKFPLHKLRGANAPFIKKNSENNCCVRVYVDAHTIDSADRATFKHRQAVLESLIE